MTDDDTIEKLRLKADLLAARCADLEESASPKVHADLVYLSESIRFMAHEGGFIRPVSVDDMVIACLLATERFRDLRTATTRADALRSEIERLTDLVLRLARHLQLEGDTVAGIDEELDQLDADLERMANDPDMTAAHERFDALLERRKNNEGSDNHRSWQGRAEVAEAAHARSVEERNRFRDDIDKAKAILAPMVANVPAAASLVDLARAIALEIEGERKAYDATLDALVKLDTAASRVGVDEEGGS